MFAVRQGRRQEERRRERGEGWKEEGEGKREGVGGVVTGRALGTFTDTVFYKQYMKQLRAGTLKMCLSLNAEMVVTSGLNSYFSHYLHIKDQCPEDPSETEVTVHLSI